MPKPKRPLKVFLCHAHADREPVRALYNRLIKDGVDAWLDKEKLLGGADWEYEIRKAVRESDVVIVCHSQQFNQRGFRQKEVKIALEEADLLPKGEIFIIPVRLEECDVLDDLRRWHWVDLFESDGYEKLMRALRVRAEKIGAALRQDKVRIIKLPLLSQGVKREQVNKEIGGSNISIDKPVRTSEKPKSEKTINKVRLNLKRWLVSSIGILFLGAITIVAIINWPNFISPDIQEVILIPAGKFTMGTNADDALIECQKTSDKCSRDVFAIAEPLHEVYLETFYIDKYEVTNYFYAKCVEAGACNPPKKINSYTHKSYYGNPQFDNYPVIFVDWFMAKNYCEWRGMRLPTEAEWEKASRGTDGRIYPWGNIFKDNSVNFCDRNCPFSTLNKNYSDNYSDVSPVGSYIAGKSFYSVYDLSGNVWEWVSSLYKPYPYVSTDGRENLNAFGSRTIRGGSWRDPADVMQTHFRLGGESPSSFYDDTGFRCARDANP